MIPSEAPERSAKARPQRRFGRARRRQFVLGGAVAGLLAITAVVVVVAVTSSGGRSGTLTSGTPSLDTIDPDSGLVNDEIHLVGTGFTGATDVQFNGVSVNSFNVISDTEISTLVPDGRTTGSVTVVTPAGNIVSSSSFAALSPVIESFSPTSIASGGTLTITGINLADVTTVRINGKETPVASANATEVTVVVPTNASSGTVAVVNAETSDESAETLTVTSPAITDIQPAAAIPGAQITLVGTELDGLSAVRFNGIAARVVSTSADGTSAVVTVPTRVTAGKISVTTASGSTTSDISFSVAPTITSFTPTTAVPGDTVTITGVNLTSTTAVTFTGAGPSSARLTVVSDTQVTVVVPGDAQTGPITVTADGSTTSTASLTIGTSISSFWPETATAGQTVTIYGSGFVGVTALRFNETPVNAFDISTADEGTQISIRVPTGATSGPISVTTQYGSATSAAKFTVGSVSASAPSYNRSVSGAVTYTPSADSPAGGTDFARAGTVTLAGITVTPTATGTTSTTTTTLKATTTTEPTTTTAPTSSSSATATTSATSTTTAPTTTVAQTPYSGSATVQIGTSSKFTATVSYTDPQTWSITPVANTTITVPLPSQTSAANVLTINTLAGSITAASGKITWALTGKTVASSLIATKFSFNSGATATFTGTCPMTQGKLCNSTGPWLNLDGEAGTTGFAAEVGDVVPNQTGMAYEAGIDLSSGMLNVDATYPVGDPVTVIDGRLRIAYKDDKFAATDDDITVDSGSVNHGLDIVFTGQSHIDIPYIGGFNLPSLTVRYIDGGTMEAFEFPLKQVLGEASLGSGAYVSGHGSPVNARVLGAATQLADDARLFVGSMQLPSYVRNAFGTGDEGEVAAIATVTGNGLYEVKAQFNTPLVLPSIPYVKATFQGFYFAVGIKLSKSDRQADLSVGASGTITIDGNSPIDVELEATVALTQSGPAFTIALTGSGTDGRAVWPNMLGVEDFDLQTFSIQVGLTSVWPYVSAGLAGTGTLPSKLLEYLGASNGLPEPATFAVDLSTSTPCLEVVAGSPDNSSTILSFPPDTGAITITYFKISASTKGCTVGVFNVPSGVTIAETGSIVGLKQDFYVAYNPKPSGPPGGVKTPSFHGWVAASIDAGQGSIDFNYRITWGEGGWNPAPYFSIDGLLKLGSNDEITVHGGCQNVSGVPSCYAKGLGTLDLGLGLSADMAIDVEELGAGTAAFSVSGDLDLAGLKFSLAGAYTSLEGAPLGWDLSASVDLPGKSALLDTLSVRLGYGLRQYVTMCGTGMDMKECTQWTTDPLFALTIEGNTGGLMKVINGAADAFGAPPVPDGGRYKLRAAWDGTFDSINFGGSTSISLGDLGTISPSINFKMCLKSSCIGNVNASFGFEYKKGSTTWSFENIALKDDWSFDYSNTYNASFSESGQVGDSKAGLKGTISGSITVGLSVSYPPVSAGLTLDTDLRARGYLGAAGTWTDIGTFDVSYESASDKFCFDADSYRVCV